MTTLVQEPVELADLWKAWPSGQLAMRGLTTREGFVVRESQSRPGVFFWNRDSVFATPPNGEKPKIVEGVAFYASRRTQRWARALRRGGLLPNVDPRDVATWACLKHDLAEAAGLDPSGEVTFSGRDGTWALSVINRHSGGQILTYDLDTEDAAQALVLLRIRLRENPNPQVET